MVAAMEGEVVGSAGDGAPHAGGDYGGNYGGGGDGGGGGDAGGYGGYGNEGVPAVGENFAYSEQGDFGDAELGDGFGQYESTAAGQQYGDGIGDEQYRHYQQRQRQEQQQQQQQQQYYDDDQQQKHQQQQQQGWV
jgi:hypothetical protein